MSNWLIRSAKYVGRGFNSQDETRGGFRPFLGTLDTLVFRVADRMPQETLNILR